MWFLTSNKIPLIIVFYHSFTSNTFHMHGWKITYRPICKNNYRVLHYFLVDPWPNDPYSLYTWLLTEWRQPRQTNWAYPTSNTWAYFFLWACLWLLGNLSLLRHLSPLQFWELSASMATFIYSSPIQMYSSLVEPQIQNTVYECPRSSVVDFNSIFLGESKESSNEKLLYKLAPNLT